MFKRRLIAADQASVFMAMMSVHISSSLVLHQMTSDHNRSELEIHDHINEPSSSKLVPKVVPLAVKTATSRQELELLFHHQMVSAENNTLVPASFLNVQRRLIAADQASVFMEMISVYISSGLVLHQMTSDHNRSELGIQDHSNEQTSSKLVPKVVPLAVKTATSRQELGLLFHLHIAMRRTTGIYRKYKIRKSENFQKDSSRHVSWNR
ncbi:hypothetical protein Tco_0130604 [Tanacetum coccineum]